MPESEFSTAVRQERSSSSLVRINCHLVEKGLIENDWEIKEEVSSIARRRLGDSGEIWVELIGFEGIPSAGEGCIKIPARVKSCEDLINW